MAHLAHDHHPTIGRAQSLRTLIRRAMARGLRLGHEREYGGTGLLALADALERGEVE